jgi:FAD-dependent urate hydroxylase
VYEAYHSTADGIGGGLSIAPNGLNALAVIEADQLVRRIGMPMTAMVIQSWTGKQLAEIGGLPGLPSTQFVWRADLYRRLYDEAADRGIGIQHGSGSSARTIPATRSPRISPTVPEPAPTS